MLFWHSVISVSYTHLAMNKESNLYFKGYVGDVYQNNKWSSLNKDSEYSQELETMDQEGISPDKWQIQMRNEVGTSETSGETSIFNHDKLTISLSLIHI